MKVPRDLVHNLMFDIDPDGLAARQPGAKKKKPQGHFITLDPNWTYSLDGHDKLMGFQNSTLPLVIYGCVDTASRKLMWLKIWTSNSNPIFIGKWYIEALLESHTLPHYLRLDKGTETTTMSTTMHIFDTSKETLVTQQSLYCLDQIKSSLLFASNQVCIQSDYPVVLNNENKTDTFFKL
jgi:hypothetical protein